MTRSRTEEEIDAQPAIWRGWAEPLSDIARDARQFLSETGAAEVWFSGAGTSAYIGDILAASPPGPLRFRSVPTTDLVADPGRFLKTHEAVLSVQFGRSGDSSETVASLDLLDQVRPDIPWLSITCNAAGALATRRPRGTGRAFPIVLPPATHDVGFAMTSSFTTMLLTALACFDSRFDPAAAMPTLAAAADDLLPRLWSMPAPRPARAVFLGSGAMQAVAQECALKVMELSAGRTLAVSESSLGFRHGPKSMLGDGAWVVVLVHPDDHVARYDHDIADEIRAQFPRAVVKTVGPRGADLPVAGTGNARADAALYALTGQVLAARWSNDLGLNVDNPFANGSLTRVVAGVSIHPYVSP